MKRARFSSFLGLSLVVLCLLIVALLAYPVATAATMTTLDPLDAAWRRAQESGVYHFATTVVETTHPAPTLANVGSGSRQQRFYLEGETDLPKSTLQMMLWQGGGNLVQSRDGVEVRIEGDRAYGRQIGGAWQEIDTDAGASAFSGAFAPGNDLMAYLVGARNVRRSGGAEEQRNGRDPNYASPLRVTHYVFDFNGLEVAAYMRDQLEDHLRKRGELPGGLTLDVSDQYRDAIGDGEVWIDGDGLPLRMTVHLEYPQQQNGERVEADIQTDFFGFDRERLAAAERPVGRLTGWLGLPRTPEGWRQVGLNFSLGFGALGLLAFAVTYRKSKRVYAAFAVAIIFSMIVTPLFQSHHVYAFSQRVAAQRVEHEQRQEEQKKAQEMQEALYSSSWNPHSAPLESASLEVGEAADLGSLLSAPLAATDDDDDETDPDSDDDGDGLTFVQEERLGTNPDEKDTDGDQITDDVEVAGFWYAGKMWYLDPREPDTNNDGQLDSAECPQQVREDKDSLSPHGVCQDTDKDGVPDAFDRDNDGDGVPDRMDLSPYNSMDNDGDPFDHGNPLLLQVDDLEANKPVFVDFQLRPENEDHLWYALNVLDWPSGDEHAQIQRQAGNDSTFADVAEEGQSIPANSDNGDVRLIPMLEIEIPYKDGHYGNLPVKEGAPVTRTDEITLGQWLDTSKLVPYGVTVRPMNDDGDLAAYAPLNLIQDETGGDRVAFSARMHYWPSIAAAGAETADWGLTQKVRVVWLVQMLTDRQDEDGEWLLDTLQIVRAYPEEWTLTGLAVREDHGLDVGITYEDPVNDTDLQYDDPLWALAEGLEASFVAGRDQDDDGERDVTIAEIDARFSITSSATITARFGISLAVKLETETFAYTHEGFIAHISMTETQQILSNTFTSYVDQGADAVTLLFSQEKRARIANLDGGDDTVTIAGNQLTLKLDQDAIPVQTNAVINWAPFRYEDGEWQSYPVAEYIDKLEVRLKDVFDEYKDEPNYDDILRGQLMVAKSYYLALYRGVGGLVQQGADLMGFAGSAQTDADLAARLEAVALEGGGWIAAQGGRLAKVIFKAGMLFRTIKKFDQGPLAKLFATIGGWGEKGVKPWSKLSGLGRKGFIALGVANVVILVAVAISLFVSVFLPESQALEIVLKTLGVVWLAVSLTSTIMGAVYRGAQSCLKLIKNVSQITENFKFCAIFFIIYSIITWGVFFYQLGTSGAKAGSLAANAAFASMIASSITLIIMLAISAIPIVGEIIATLVWLIDSIAMWICSATESENWFCKHGGIEGVISEAITWIIYSANVMVNIEYPYRLDIEEFEQDFVDPDKGLSAGNSLIVNTTLDNRIRLIEWSDTNYDWKAGAYWWQYSEKTLKSSTFDYQLHTWKKDIHENLDRGDISGDWENVGEHHVKLIKATDRKVPLEQAGINRNLPLYLAEGYALPVQECWAIPIFFPIFFLLPVCYVRTERDTGHINLGQSMYYDVFPPTLDEFYALVEKDSSGGASAYALAWSQDSDPSFPRLKDADGDGLRNRVDDGADPDDHNWDTDGDRLSDFFEVQQGSDPRDVDSDGDGLTDREEVILGTDPLRTDTDYDGLTDKEEVDGWEFVYDFAEDGSQIRTWVTSDPLNIDADMDELTDFQEKTFGFHPGVPSDPHVLTLDSLVREEDAPLLLLRLDETEHASTFRDDSGYANNGTCDGDACPTSGHYGKYGNAPQFDGTDDYVEVSHTDQLNPGDELTLAVWVRLTDPLVNQKIVGKTTTGDGYLLGVSDGKLYPELWDNQGNRYTAQWGVVPADTWTHLAVTWQTGGDMVGFINGVQVGRIAAAPNPIGGNTSPLRIGVAPWNPNVYPVDGRIDEALVFDRALDQAEVQEIADGHYNTADYIVRPGDTLYYQASVKNKLFNRYAQGLLSTSFPAAFSEMPPVDFILNPQEGVVLTGTVTVAETVATGAYSLTQEVDAMITDWREESNYAELLYHFAEDEPPFKDSSGSQPPRDGDCASPYCPASTTGKYGNGLDFDGSNDYVTADKVVEYLGSDALTFGAWAYPESGKSGRGAILAFNGRGYSSRNVVVGYDWDNNRFYYYDGGMSVYSPLESGNTFALDQWHQVMVVIDDDVGYLYVDGNREASFTPDVNLQDRDRFSIGHRWYSDYIRDSFSGKIDEPVIFNRALSADDVQAYYSDPVFDLPLDEPEGATTFEDASAFDNDAVCDPSPPMGGTEGGNCPTAGEDGLTSNSEAALFSGDDYLSVDGSSALDLSDGDFTLSTWVYPTGGPDNSDCAFRADYWNHVEYQGTWGWERVFGRCESWPIDYDWEAGGPEGGVHDDDFWVRWFADNYFEEGDYTFRATHDDDIYVELDGQPIIRSYDVGSDQVTVHVSEGKHRIYVSYREEFGDAYVSFDWTPAPAFQPQGILGGEHADPADSYPTIQRVDNNEARISFRTTGGDTVELASGADVLRSYRWNHLVATYDGQYYELYVNGVEVGEALSDDGPASNAAFEIGRTDRNASVFFDHLDHHVCGSEGAPGCEYVIEYRERGGDWTEIWRGDRFYHVGGGYNREADLNIERFFQDYADFRVYEDDTSEGDDDGNSGNDSLGQYRLYADDPSHEYVREFENTITGDKLTLRWNLTPDSIPFRGKMDQVTIYRRAFDAGEVGDLYDAGTLALHMPLDDPPGSNEFADALGQATGTCDPSPPMGGNEGGSCPTVGVPGRDNFALRFDGDDDYVEINEANTGDLQELTVAAWVKPLSLPSGEIMRFVTLGNEKTVLRYDGAQGPGQLHFYMNVDDALHHVRVDHALQADTWHHVAGTYDSETMTLYLNGQPVGSGLAVTGTVGGGDEVRLSHAAETLDGLLDEVIVYRRALSADEIEALYESAPELLLYLDETEGATTFQDASGNGHDGPCSGSKCPNPGVKGQLGLAADFDGENDYIQVPHSDRLNPGDEMTLAVWVKMTDADVDQKLVGKTNGAHNRGYVLGIEDGRLYPEIWDVNGTCTYTQCGRINAGYWTHLAVTWQTGGDMVAYINGEAACRVDATLQAIGGSDDPLIIGAAPWSVTNYLANGRIDHVTLYRRALSSREMRALFRLQAKWVEERQSTRITVDDDEPTSTLVSDDVYRPNQDVLLLVSAADDTSPVTMVELGVSTDGGAHYTWETAPRCQDAAVSLIGGAAWCPTFEPAIGEGRYLLQTRATDGVGNVETPSHVYTFLVDDAPPDLAAAIQDGELIQATRTPTQTWLVSLTGTISDPGIRGASQPGSGPAEVSVRLTATAHPTDTMTPRTAALSGNDWQLDFSLPYADATGWYTLSARATDAVGNVGPFVDLVNVGIDVSPPEVSLDPVPSPVTGTITTTLTLTGLVTETGVVSAGIAGVRVGLIPAAQAGMSRTVGMFHLDEPPGATRFASDTGGAAACEGSACPTAGVDGMWGTALDFGSYNDSLYLTADFVSGNITDARGFSFGAWVYPDYNPYDGVVLAFNAADGGDRNMIYHQDYGFRYRDGDVTTTGAYAWEQWAHVMVTIDEGGQGVLYVDGVAEETFSTSVRPDPNGRFSIGQEWDGDTPSQFFDGLIDEVAVYDRALSPEEVYVVYADAALSDSGDGVITTTWAYTVPNTLDGIYQLNLRPGDVFNNTGERPDWPVWNGEIDTAAPRVEATAEEKVSYLSIKTTYTCRAQDFNLIQVSEDHPEDSFKCYCQTVAPHATVYTRTYYHEVSPWYADTFTDTRRLYELEATCTVLGPAVGAPDATMKACDAYGHCATAVPPSSEILAYELIDSAVLTPTQNAVITSTAAISLTGRAYASHSLKTIQVLVDGVPIDTHTWATPGVTSTQWASTWVPPFEGRYMLNSCATDHNDDTQDVEHPIEVIVDVLPPFVDILPTLLTTTHRLSQDRVALSGRVTDTNGLDAVQVSIDNGDWQDAAFYGGEWRLDWYLGEEPAGKQYTVTARATDVAGHTARVTETVTVDLQRPNPITLTLSSGGAVVTPGTVLTTTPALLDLSWVTSTSRIDLLPYEVIWTIHATQTNQFRHPVPTTGPFSSTYPAGEAQRIAPKVVSRFADGNRQVDTYGSVYVDSPLTPDYITLETARGERRPYLGWMESGCSRMGVDRRAQRNAPGSAAIDDQQALYVTWDSEALRLVWTGANWDYAGDLFIYLDTKVGGALKAYNPFTDTAGTTVKLPGSVSFGADVLIWVEDSDVAHFLSWTTGIKDWDISLLSPDYYRFDEGLHDGHTDLYLPFDLLGITNPLTNPLALIAFATEEEGMNLWGTMPPENPVNSERVVETLEFISRDEEHPFALTHAYVWPTLAAGICPNLVYGDADVQIGLTADPLGSTYSFLGDDLFWLWEDLFDPDRPPGLSDSFMFMDVDHPPVGDGDTITYTLHYINRGTDAAPGVDVLLTGLYALRFGGNVTQVVSLGSIEPGEQGTATFQGQIDLEAARTDYYTPCLSAGSPITCEQYLDWAALAAYTFDASLHPLDWSWADHRVDGDPPEFFDIQQPELFVNAGSNTLRGYAYDESGVPTLTLSVESPAGTTTCPDTSPDDGRWSCQWDATAANGGTSPADGDQFNLRLQATDSYAQSSVWTGWRTFIVDTVPPSVTFSAQSRAYSDTVVGDARLIFRGAVSDNRGVAGVAVCLEDESGEEECGSASVQAVGEFAFSMVYTDAQSALITDTTFCGGGEIEVEFDVPDVFTVGEVSLGLNADHARRNDISATLTSPAGTSVQVLGPKEGTPPDYQNYDVLLYDAAATGLHEFKGDDDTTEPFFDRETRPADPMRVFQGEDSAGTWTLNICDTYPITYHGVYSHSQLTLKLQNTAVLTGNWSYLVANLDDLDGVVHTATAYATDLVGNRSAPISLTFEMDNVAPALEIESHVGLTFTFPNRAPVQLLAGGEGDGGRIVQMYAFVQTPAGDLVSLQVDRGASWWFDLKPDEGGDYTIWINAIDAAGNTTTAGPSVSTIFAVPAGALATIVKPEEGSTPNLVYTDTQGMTTTVEAAAGAVDETIILVYTPISTPTQPIPSGWLFANHAFELDAYRGVDLLTDYVFAEPISITIHYTDTDVIGMDEETLTLYHWDGNSWVDAACGAYDRHPDENWLSVSICHLTPFALLWPAPVPVGGVTASAGLPELLWLQIIFLVAVITVEAVVVATVLKGGGRRSAPSIGKNSRQK